MAPDRKSQLLRAALLALAGGTIVAFFNPGAAIEQRADKGTALIDRVAIRAVALIENQPRPPARTAASSAQ